MKSYCIGALLVSATQAQTAVNVSTPISTSAWECLVAQNSVQYALVRAYRSVGDIDSAAAASIKAARSAGVKQVDAYIFPCMACGYAASQVSATYVYLNNAGASPDIYWYDVEAFDLSQGNEPWSSDLYFNQAFINAMIDEGKRLGIKAGIYTSYYQWKAIVGLGYDSPAYQGLPLWYSNYEKPINKSFSDFKAFGGWYEPLIKQYHQKQAMCGVKVDLNYVPSLIADQASVIKVPGASKCKRETIDDSEYWGCLKDANFQCDQLIPNGGDSTNKRTGCNVTREEWFWRDREYECAGTPTTLPATYCANMKCVSDYFKIVLLGEDTVAAWGGGYCTSVTTSATRVGSRFDTSVTLVGSLAVVVIAIYAVTF